MGVGFVALLRDLLAVAGTEFSLLVLTIVGRVFAAVFAASRASWYCLSNLFNAQELVVCPSSFKYANDPFVWHHLLLL